MEDDHIKNRKNQDIAEADEKNITPEEARHNREKALKKATEKVKTDEIVWMSDELSADELGSTNESVPSSREKASVETPGNAQYLETPTVTMPIDFSGISNEILFGKQKEVYRLKANKLEGLVDC